MKKLLIPVLLVAFLGCAEQKEDAVAWYNKGVALCELGKNEEALKAFDKAIELKSDYAEAWLKKSVVLLGLGRNEDAFKSSEKANELRSQK